jgi:hypothetical protein
LVTPLVSVLLPVYNGAEFLHEAIRSILGQTYENFELIAIDDGSTDESLSIIQSYSDPRVKSFTQKNMGLPATLNRAIELSRGHYFARQDADDIALPTRFEKQVAFLETNPDYGLVGTWASILEGTRETNRALRHPSDDIDIRFELLFDCQFVHSSVMIRKTALDMAGFYSTDPSRHPPEDYDLWCRITRYFKVANISEILQIYREVPSSICRSVPFLNNLVRISAEHIAFTAKKNVDEDIVNLSALVHGAFSLVSGNPSFRRISALLSDAVAGLAVSASERERLAKRESWVLKTARWKYLDHKYGARVASMIAIVEKFLPRMPV